jgi:hypothetical protein
MKTAVEQAVDALRLWSNDWNEFDKTGENKPKSIEEVIAPFIQMEKEQMIAFGKKCFYKGFDKAENDDANCFTAWREEAEELLTKQQEQ